MRRDMTPRSNKSGQLPVNYNAGFLSPWFDDFFEQNRRLDDLFSRQMTPFFNENRSLSPAIDIDENDKEYIVQADLPGLKKEDISIECSGQQLTISAERKYESDENQKSGRRERYYGSYQRSFTLPAGAVADKIEASYDDGVLSVRIPKGEEAKARRIEIGARKSTASPKNAEAGPQAGMTN